MRIVKILLAAIVLGLLGTAGFAAARDQCSYSPGGQFKLGLVREGIAHFFDDERACDPWKVVEPDDTVRSVTILPYSSWTDAPARAVTINRNGTMLISDPVPKKAANPDWPEWDYRRRVEFTEPELARDLMASLTRITRYNRLTTEDPEVVRGRLEADDADASDLQSYLLEPKIPCHGAMYDGGGVTLEIVMVSGERREVALDSACHSVAKQTAIDTAWDARQSVFKHAHFTEDHYVDELGTF
tara:strand:+ start:152 stop:880 length:729 start_codon:yes stop_codon:yes gene_type:complete